VRRILLACVTESDFRSLGSTLCLILKAPNVQGKLQPCQQCTPEIIIIQQAHELMEGFAGYPFRPTRHVGAPHPGQAESRSKIQAERCLLLAHSAAVLEAGRCLAELSLQVCCLVILNSFRCQQDYHEGGTTSLYGHGCGRYCFHTVIM
jgi:hypothetical protein